VSKVNPRLVYWIAALYDHKELKAAHHLILIYLAARKLDYSTGAGYCSVPTLAAELGNGAATVRRALDIAQKVGVLERTSRGYRRGDGTVTASTWQILYPPQPLASEQLTSISTDQKRAVETASTAQNDGLNRSLAVAQPLASEHPTGSEISGSESPSDPLASALALLRAIDAAVTDDETREVIRILDGRGARDAVAVLGTEIRKGNGYRLLGEARHRLDRQQWNADAGRPAPRKLRPSKCKSCERTLRSGHAPGCPEDTP
jgi:hypothetical protein